MDKRSLGGFFARDTSFTIERSKTALGQSFAEVKDQLQRSLVDGIAALSSLKTVRNWVRLAVKRRQLSGASEEP
jgi:hypothetical protein